MNYTSVLAQRYAEGLWRAVQGGGEATRVSDELHTFLTLFSQDGPLREVVVNPAYPARVRAEVINDLHENLNLSDLTYNFLRLLLEKRRIHEIEGIVAAFDQLHRDSLGIVQAEVTAAHEVDSATHRRLEAVVQKITGKTPELIIRLDPSILGGYKIRMGNTVVDATVKGRLENLRGTLLDPSAAI